MLARASTFGALQEIRKLTNFHGISSLHLFGGKPGSVYPGDARELNSFF